MTGPRLRTPAGRPALAGPGAPCVRAAAVGAPSGRPGIPGGGGADRVDLGAGAGRVVLRSEAGSPGEAARTGERSRACRA